MVPFVETYTSQAIVKHLYCVDRDGRPNLHPIHFGPTCFRPNLIGLDENRLDENWTHGQRHIKKVYAELNDSAQLILDVSRIFRR